MDLKYLQTLKTIIHEGSFSKAADKLGYTQSTITFQVQQLEQEFTTKLFEKIGRKMVLTKDGENIIPYVNEVLSSVEKLKNFSTEKNLLHGDLYIATAETLLCYRMPTVLKRFKELAPQARLFMRSMNCNEIRDALLSGSVDLGFLYQEIRGIDKSMIIYPIKEETLTLVASPKTKELFPDFISTNQQLGVPLIIDEQNCIFRNIFENYLREKKIRLDHTIELWSIPTIKNLLISNMGISYLPTFTVEQELLSGELVEIATELSAEKITAVCGHHKNKWLSPLMKLFIDLVTDKAE